MIFFGQLFLVDWVTRQAQHLRDLSRAKWRSFSSVPFSSRYQVNSIILTMVSPFSRKNHDQEAFRLLTWPLWYYDRFVCLSFFSRTWNLRDKSLREQTRLFRIWPHAMLVHRGKWWWAKRRFPPNEIETTFQAIQSNFRSVEMHSKRRYKNCISLVPRARETWVFSKLRGLGLQC